MSTETNAPTTTPILGSDSRTPEDVATATPAGSASPPRDGTPPTQDDTPPAGDGTPPGGVASQAGSNHVTINIPNNVPVSVPSSLIEMHNLVDMQIDDEDTAVQEREKKVALVALAEWKEADSVLEGKVERRIKQTDKLIYEIYQLVGLYSVFVGVVFTAVLQSDKVKCQHIWSPVLLCVSAWIVIILVTKKRLRKYDKLCVTLKTDRASRTVIFGQIRKLKQFGYKRFSFAKYAADSVKPKDESSKSIFFTSSWVILTILTILTLILVGSFVHMLCLTEIASKLRRLQ